MSYGQIFTRHADLDNAIKVNSELFFLKQNFSVFGCFLKAQK